VAGGGASLSIRQNPVDPDGSVLTVAGDNDEQLLHAARALALTKTAKLGANGAAPTLGDSVRIGDYEMPKERQPDDAPRWLLTDKLTSLWALSSRQALQSDGTKPLPIYFRVPPDLYYGENQNLNLSLNYRYNALPLAAGSALRVFVNGSMVNEAPLPAGRDFADHQRTVLLPVANLRPFGNTFVFNFDFIPTNPNADTRTAAQTLAGSILQNSYLDIRGMAHWAEMPNLELFANAGFPFTRRADLADTVIVVPTTPTAKEITLLLYLMSHFGTQTGYPALRVQIAGPEAVMRGDRDYLMLGDVSDQPAFSSLYAALPVTFDAQGIHVKQPKGYLAMLRAYWRRITGVASPGTDISNADGVPDLLIEGLESPFFPGRSIVMLEMRSDQVVEDFADVFLERSQSSDIAHSVSLLRNGKFSSYVLDAPVYHVGVISPYALMRLWLVEHFWMLLIAVTVLSLVMATYSRDYLALLTEARLKVDVKSPA
jgi:cellulose synthase (UDP-forming)